MTFILIAGCTSNPTIQEAASVSGTPASGKPASSAPPTALRLQLTGMIGTWKGQCKDHKVDTLIITRTTGTTDAVDVVTWADHYGHAKCIGRIVATSSESGTVRMKYAGSVKSASVMLKAGEPASLVPVEQMKASTTATALVVKGPDVRSVIKDGQLNWCFAYDDVGGRCIADPGARPALDNPQLSSVHVSDTEMYLLSPKDNPFAVELRYFRR